MSYDSCHTSDKMTVTTSEEILRIISLTDIKVTTKIITNTVNIYSTRMLVGHGIFVRTIS